MADFGVLKTVIDLLNSSSCFKKDNGKQMDVYVSHPTPKSHLPMVVIELEEIWTSLALSKNSPRARLKLKARTMSDKHTTKESFSIAEKVRSLIDGRTLALPQGNKVTFKLENSVIDLPTQLNKTRCVQQYFEAIVRC